MPIRKASIGDLDQITELRLRFLAENRDVGPAELSDEFRTQTRRFLHRHTVVGTAISWLAGDRAGSAVGVVTMLLLDLAPRPEDTTGAEGYIINMYVEPDERRRGIGSELLSVCLASARDMELRRVLLNADRGRPTSVCQCGLQREPEVAGAFVAPRATDVKATLGTDTGG